MSALAAARLAPCRVRGSACRAPRLKATGPYFERPIRAEGTHEGAAAAAPQARGAWAHASPIVARSTGVGADAGSRWSHMQGARRARSARGRSSRAGRREGRPGRRRSCRHRTAVRLFGPAVTESKALLFRECGCGRVLLRCGAGRMLCRYCPAAAIYGCVHWALYVTLWENAPPCTSLPYGVRFSLNHSGLTSPPPSPPATAVSPPTAA